MTAGAAGAAGRRWGRRGWWRRYEADAPAPAAATAGKGEYHDGRCGQRCGALHLLLLTVRQRLLDAWGALGGFAMKRS